MSAAFLNFFFPFPIGDLFLQPQCYDTALLIFRSEFIFIWKIASTGTNEKHLRNAAFLSQQCQKNLKENKLAPFSV